MQALLTRGFSLLHSNAPDSGQALKELLAVSTSTSKSRAWAGGWLVDRFGGAGGLVGRSSIQSNPHIPFNQTTDSTPWLRGSGSSSTTVNSRRRRRHSRGSRPPPVSPRPRPPHLNRPRPRPSASRSARRRRPRGRRWRMRVWLCSMTLREKRGGRQRRRQRGQRGRRHGPRRSSSRGNLDGCR